MNNDKQMTPVMRSQLVVLLGICVLPALLQAQAVLTAEYDINRTGAYVSEVTLTPQNVGGGTFGFKWSYPVDGCVYAHPLYAPQVSIAGQLHNVIYIATANNSIYAYDADTAGAPLWHKGPDVLGAATTPADGDIRDCVLSNGSPGPTGIIGTPTIANGNPPQQFIWFVNGVKTTGTAGQYYLRALDISNGNLISSTLVADPQGKFIAKDHLQRPGLFVDLSDTYINFGFASHQDAGPWQGWIFSYLTDGSSLQGALNLSPNANTVGAGVWMSGGGIASDGNYVYFTTGNMAGDGQDAPAPPEYPNSIVQVGIYGGPVVGAYSVPAAEQRWWNQNDLDLSASRAILVPGTSYVISGSKWGDIIIANRTAPMSSGSLQGRVHVCAPNVSTTDPATVQEPHWAFNNGFAFWNNTVFTWCADNDALKAFNFNNLLAGSASPAQSASTNPPPGGTVGLKGGNLAISANGTSNGIVWATYPVGGQFAADEITGGELIAFDAGNLAANGGTGIFQSNLIGLYYQKFTPPVIAHGRVYVPVAGGAGGPQVLVYGLP